MEEKNVKPVKKVNKTKKAKKVKEKKPYINPYKTTLGKVLIWVLSLGMVAGILVALIQAIIKMASTV